jgi:hypothetical protein
MVFTVVPHFLSFCAGSYNSSTGEFLPQENDFYFLPDPRDLIYTHFPHNPAEKDYRSHDLKYKNSEAEFLDKIQTIVLRVFLLVIHSHFYMYSFALRSLFLQTQAISYSFYEG